MKRNRFTQVGLDRPVRLAWLEKASSLVLAGNQAKDIKSILQDDLQGSFRSNRTDVRGSMDKTITILMKVWLTVPDELESLRIEGLERLRNAPQSDHIALHWGMLMAVYPFWSEVATKVGRLLMLQGSVAASQVQRRVREQTGERETVSRRARYVLRSFLDWGVLQESEKKGIYHAGPTVAVENAQLATWLVEASLHSRVSGSAPLQELLNNPSLFPFRLMSIHSDILTTTSTNLDISRQGLNEDIVRLRKPGRN